MLDTHRVSLASLDALAEGRSDPAVVEQLKLANRSRHLILLRAVLDRATAESVASAPLPPPAEAWTLLAAAQQRDAAAADVVLDHPQTGLWAANLLRRLGSDDPGDPPLWADLGGLHLLATAAAIRAGLHFRSRVPVWRGAVMLPTLGRADVQGRREWDFAHVHGQHGHVLVRGPAGSVRLPADRAADGAGWQALRTLHAGNFRLWLDDLDPSREFGAPLAPRRLPAAETARWAEALSATWDLLARHHSTTAAELAAGLTTLVPRDPADPHTPSSASHNDAFGSVVLSRPPDATTFAATLVHEFQHSKLGILLTLVDLLDPLGDNETPRLYAPWRDDPRPPTGLLHGVFSFLGVTAFYREHLGAETGLAARAAQFEFAYRREQTAHAVATLLAEVTPSALGRRFLIAAGDRLRTWAGDPVPADVLAAARRANLDHRLSWRLRHLTPPAAVTGELAEAWLRHRRKPVTTPPAPLLTPTPGASPRPRLPLARIWLTEPELFDLYRCEPELATAEIPGTTEADLALVDGDLGAAAALYRQEVLIRPEALGAWAGLALTAGDATLLGLPELVFAVHREIRLRTGTVTDPVRLARWLARES
ncbi:HEXXH motif-containing putative peptide modification protein [Amycolatopsis sp. NPDC058278]|uniref:HEXXH motif domain-containing protein n=1 Tax=Amycolatopsis sp. NPDC058278 TaxID=3346417 RepID=UPI0036D94BAF